MFFVLQTWELVVLSQLNWDVNILTAHDFVDFILVRSPSQATSNPNNKYSQVIRRHALTFISLCYTGKIASLFQSFLLHIFGKFYDELGF